MAGQQLVQENAGLRAEVATLKGDLDRRNSAIARATLALRGCDPEAKR